MKVSERFIQYVKIDTQSDEDSSTCPSTMKQKDLGQLLVQHLREAGCSDASIDDNGYVYGHVEATKGCEDQPVIGLIAHMDTAPACSGSNVRPAIIENYDGRDIVLNKEKNIVMKTAVFPDMLRYKGQDLIVTDGTTLLGADDKAGVAEIVSAVEYIVNNDVPHGRISIGFTPDEEVGRGADHFDVKKFGADFAYTIDGTRLGETEYENFNAASIYVKVHGTSIHLGDAKNKLKSALLMGIEFNSMLPDGQTPAHTEKYEGYYHLAKINGTESEASMEFLIRDHDKDNFERRKETIRKITDYLNDKYGKDTFEVEIKDSYYNMYDQLKDKMFIVDRAMKAMEDNGVTPVTNAIRGGTDGARLSYEGLPCPNLSTGGENLHSVYEYVPIQALEKMTEVIVSIVTAHK